MYDNAHLATFLRRVFEQRGARKTPHPPARILGLLGSSREDGHTAALAHAVFRHFDDAHLIDIAALSIAPYDYNGKQCADDFLPLAQAMTKAEAIVFASPVYWYSMSAQMKALFDRLTDLTEDYKPLGKSLAGKSAFLIATGGSHTPGCAFEPPFQLTADYFDMRWGGMFYARNGIFDDRSVENFAQKIEYAIGNPLRSAA